MFDFTEKRPAPTRLMFEDTFEAEPKVPRYNRDPFDNIAGRVLHKLESMHFVFKKIKTGPLIKGLSSND